MSDSNDFSVYVTLKNQTNENLTNGGADAEYGKWIGFPTEIPYGKTRTFVLSPDSRMGSQGHFDYVISGEKDPKTRISEFGSFVADPQDGSNKVDLRPYPQKAVYVFEFCASTGKETKCKPGEVSPLGHPVHVEYTLRYEAANKYKFKLLEITSNSTHPVRNSRGDLILGKHLLYDWQHPSSYIDKDRGSFEPNVLGYKFDTRILPTTKVTVEPVNAELIGAEVILFATYRPSSIRIFQSDYFIFMGKTTVSVNILDPKKSSEPFSFNTDVDWKMELKRSGKGILPKDNAKTRLELYWIAETRHVAFKSNIPVGFLRRVLPYQVAPDDQATNVPFFQRMTERVFTEYDKVYDTMKGASHFGLFPKGGVFKLNFYLFGDKEENPYPMVNCMDQAAMLQLSCSLEGGNKAPSWLWQMPFGYINETDLVGIPYKVNNPFYGTDRSIALLADINDRRRTYFKLHVFIGHSKPLKPRDDGIYDACTGPHTGTMTIKEYNSACIDRQTILYKDKKDPTKPGSVNKVREGDGVLAIDSTIPDPPQPTPPTRFPLPKPLSHLVNTAVDPTLGPLMHVGWAHIPTWLNATLGNAWNILFDQVSVDETTARAFWIISDTNPPKNPIRVNVDVISVVTEGGHLDMVESTAVVKESISDILMSTQRHDIWTSGTLPNLEGVSLQYADHIEAGRIVLVAGNIIMDIAGMTSTEALLPYALKLFNRTVRHDVGRFDHSLLAVPMLQRQGISPMGAEMDIITVTGKHARFSLVFSVNCKIAAANACSKGYGVLFDRHIVKELDNEEGCTVEFFFITAETGRYRVYVFVADLETMVGAKAELEVEVVDGEEKYESDENEHESCEQLNDT